MGPRIRVKVPATEDCQDMIGGDIRSWKGSWAADDHDRARQRTTVDRTAAFRRKNDGHMGSINFTL